MSLQPILINGSWESSQEPDGSFQAMNPSTKEALPDEFPVSNLTEVERMLDAAQEAVAELRGVPAETIAEFLEVYASKIEGRSAELVETAQLETALGKEPRLNTIELPRTTNQLRQAATAARERSWSHATIDTASNIRSMYGPLGGPVAVFGPNNFPFAFNSAAGGDFAAAIAAGNPVIAKANTSHPKTSQIFGELALEAVKQVGLPRAMVQLLYRTRPENGLKLVSHPLIGATAFTGSKAGLRLKEAADEAGKPIYLELSAVNPVFVLPGTLDERLPDVADEFLTSCTMGTGQFCTNPGLVILMQNEQGESFAQTMKEKLAAAPNGTLLSAGGPQGVAHAIQVWQEHGAEIVVGGEPADELGYSFSNTLLRVSGDKFIEHPHELQEEAFGVASLLIFAKDAEQMATIASKMEGSLTGTIYSHTGGADDGIYDQVEPILRTKVGRLSNDKMPTGVAVVSAMNHGGPYPATGHPGFTAVGIPASMLRFGALHCYDNVRAHRLPPELRDENPTGDMWRLIDGVWSQGDVLGSSA